MWGLNGKKTTALAEDREKRRTKRVERDEKCQAKKGRGMNKPKLQVKAALHARVFWLIGALVRKMLFR